MGDLLKEIKTERLRTGGRTHLITQILEQLPEADREDLRKALLDEGIGHQAIASVLNRRGFKVLASSVATWRKRYGAS